MSYRAAADMCYISIGQWGAFYHIHYTHENVLIATKLTTNNDVRHWPFNYEDTIKRRLAEYRIYEKSYDIITEDNNVQFTNIPKWLSIGKNPRHQQPPLPSAPFFATGFEWSKHFQIGIQWNSKNHPHQGINSHERMKCTTEPNRKLSDFP